MKKVARRGVGSMEGDNDSPLQPPPLPPLTNSYSHHESGGGKTGTVIDMPVCMLLLSAVPLLTLGALSHYHLDLNISGRIVTSMIRSFVQLLVLGISLCPIFFLGIKYAIMTASVDCCMITMAYHVASSRPLHTFEGQFKLVLTDLATNVSLALELTYGIIVRPMIPAWDP